MNRLSDNRDSSGCTSDQRLKPPFSESLPWGTHGTEAINFAQQSPTVPIKATKGKALDLVLEDRSGNCVGIKVKAGAAIGSGDTAGLRAFAEQIGSRFRRGIVLYTMPYRGPEQ